MKLRPYQQESISALPRLGRCVIELPTGTGKTVVMAHLVKAQGSRTIILAHRDEIIRQIVDKLQVVNNCLDIGIVQGETNQVGAQVVVASIQTVSRMNRLQWLKQDWALCLVDEAHHAFAPTYRRVIDFVNAPLTVGFTATAYRTQGQESLLQVFPQGVVYRKSLLQMIAAGYLCDIKARRVHLDVDLDGVGMRGGDFEEADLGRILRAEGAVEAVVEAYHEEASARKTLVFAADVAHAEALTAAINDHGYLVGMVHGKQELAERRSTLQAFRSGFLKVLVNCAVLLEGYDEPSIECVIVARPTLSRLLYTQMIGRGTRKHPGKDDCLILDCVGATGRYSVETMASLFNIKEETAEKGIQALLEEGTHAEQEELRVAGVTIEDIDLLRQGSIHWVQDQRPTTHTTRYLCSVGDAIISLQPGGNGLWDIKEIPRQRGVLARKLYTELSLEYAQGTAEDLVRSRKVEKLAGVGMSWRHHEPTPNQLELLKRMRVPGAPKSKGEAADWITRKMAEGR